MIRTSVAYDYQTAPAIGHRRRDNVTFIEPDMWSPGRYTYYFQRGAAQDRVRNITSDSLPMLVRSN